MVFLDLFSAYSNANERVQIALTYELYAFTRCFLDRPFKTGVNSDIEGMFWVIAYHLLRRNRFECFQ